MVINNNRFHPSMEYIDGITIVDTSGTILFSVKFNPSLYPDAKSDNIIGKKIHEIWDIPKDTSTLVKAMATGHPVFKKKQVVIDLHGKEIETTNLSMPIKIDGRTIGAIEISKEINKEKEQNHQDYQINKEMFDGNNLIKDRLNSNKTIYTLDDIISRSKKIEELKYIVRKVAGSSSPVFIYGETGTGKELLAHSIHNESSRASQPFISQNCAAIPENLLESILFGTTKGSFTGAVDSPGLFEIAEGGTLFLDEINSMSQNLQSKLLRVLQNGLVRRLGDTSERKVDVRIISTSNKKPNECVQAGELRKDIYFRLSVINLNIPPLRERKEDIELLLNYFINKQNNLLGKRVNKVSKEVFNFFMNYNWPGNVRELENVIEYGMNIIDKNQHTIEMEDIEERAKEMLEFSKEETKTLEMNICPLKDAISTVEKEIITKALAETKGNASAAARMLEIPRQTLQRKARTYKIK